MGWKNFPTNSEIIIDYCLPDWDEIWWARSSQLLHITIVTNISFHFQKRLPNVVAAAIYLSCPALSCGIRLNVTLLLPSETNTHAQAIAHHCSQPTPSPQLSIESTCAGNRTARRPRCPRLNIPRKSSTHKSNGTHSSQPIF